jgi:PhoH-like ATPase
MALKNLMLTTNVLLHDPGCVLQLGDNTVVIAIAVIERVDTFNKNPSELGRHAPRGSRQIDASGVKGA